MRNKKTIHILKYVSYAVLFFLLYVLQGIPGLFAIAGIKPIWVIPAAVVLAMMEGEFVGGIYGVFAGLLCDMGGFLLFGFSGLIVGVCCIVAGLLAIYLMRCNLFSCMMCVLVTMLIHACLTYVFGYGMWGYEGAWQVFAFSILPVAAYSTLVTPIVYYVVRGMYRQFETRSGGGLGKKGREIKHGP